MNDDHEGGAARVRLLARYAELPLSPQREAVVAAILDAWVPAANELSRRMSAPQHRDVLPITVLTPVKGDLEEPS